MSGLTEGTVYIIDDDEFVRAGLANLIQSTGLRVEAFASTRDFMSETHVDGPRCLVLDIRMPGTSGLDFQDELAKANISIPIIFMTGHGDIPMSVRAMKAGAVEFLTEPVREQDLLDAIQNALNRDRVQHDHARTLAVLRTREEALTLREREVVILVTRGKMNKQIAAEIGLSEVTVKVDRRNAMQKLSAKSLAELVRIVDALEIGCKKKS